MIIFFNWDTMCFLCGRNWIFKYHLHVPHHTKTLCWREEHCDCMVRSQLVCVCSYSYNKIPDCNLIKAVCCLERGSRFSVKPAQSSLCSHHIDICLDAATPYFHAVIYSWAAIIVLSICSTYTEAAESCPMNDVDIRDSPHCVLLYSPLIWLIQNESG